MEYQVDQMNWYTPGSWLIDKALPQKNFGNSTDHLHARDLIIIRLRLLCLFSIDRYSVNY